MLPMVRVTASWGSTRRGSGLPTQQQDGQNDYQRDHNEFGVLGYLHTVDSHTQARLSFGLIHNDLDILNNNPSINLSAIEGTRPLPARRAMTTRSSSIRR